jgi:hypothetical protein
MPAVDSGTWYESGMNQPGLLAYLSLQFARSEENCATEALTFLLRGCPEARAALRGHVARLFGVDLSPHLTYRSQVTDPETGRPDVVGTDPAGADQLVIEAKFWAGLTDKQPGAYLERLRAGEPGVVLVVAPAARLQSLWRELLANLAEYRNEPVASADHEPGRYEKPCNLATSWLCAAGARCTNSTVVCVRRAWATGWRISNSCAA